MKGLKYFWVVIVMGMLSCFFVRPADSDDSLLRPTGKTFVRLKTLGLACILLLIVPSAPTTMAMEIASYESNVKQNKTLQLGQTDVENRALQQSKKQLTRILVKRIINSLDELKKLDTLIKKVKSDRPLVSMGQFAYDKPWYPNIDTKDKDLSDSLPENPLSIIVDFVTDKPVVFGQDVDQHRFHTKGYDGPESDKYKMVFWGKDDLRLRATFNSDKTNVAPSFIVFPNIEKTAESSVRSQNIVTKAAAFIFNLVRNHEQSTGYGSTARLKERAVSVVVKDDTYYCSKSVLYDHATMSDKEISCQSKSVFEKLSRWL